NPAIDFEKSPFIVNNTLIPWETHGPRRAGVISFGVGGTNVHLALEEYVEPPNPAQRHEPGPSLISWSAATEASARMYADRLVGYLADRPNVNLHALAATLSGTRQPLRFRNYVVAADSSDLLTKLKQQSWQKNVLGDAVEHVVFMFPGQGAQYPGMGQELYNRFESYRNAVDTCSDILKEVIYEDIRKIILSDNVNTLRETYYTLPAIFVTEYALAKLWMSGGVEPTAFIGHSVGEFVGACLAGVFSLYDALSLIACRGRL